MYAAFVSILPVFGTHSFIFWARAFLDWQPVSRVISRHAPKAWDEFLEEAGGSKDDEEADEDDDGELDDPS